MMTSSRLPRKIIRSDSMALIPYLCYSLTRRSKPVRKKHSTRTVQRIVVAIRRSRGTASKRGCFREKTMIDKSSTWAKSLLLLPGSTYHRERAWISNLLRAKTRQLLIISSPWSAATTTRDSKIGVPLNVWILRRTIESLLKPLTRPSRSAGRSVLCTSISRNRITLIWGATCARHKTSLTLRVSSIKVVTRHSCMLPTKTTNAPARS